MKKIYIRSILAGLLAILLTSATGNTAPVVRAQSLQYWADPVNLSNSGSSTDPQMVVDSDGGIHVTWVDAIDGYKYAESTDGKVWTAAKSAKFPFSVKDDSKPAFFATANGLIYVVWLANNKNLYVAQTQPRFFGISSSWGALLAIAGPTVAAYDAVVDSQGALELSYVLVGGSSSPAGIYYARVGPGASPKPVNIYQSEYFRSLDSTSAHVRIATSTKAGNDAVYIAWDDRPQKRIFLAKSPDGGQNWGQASQVTGPEAVTGTSIPFNVDLGVMNDEVLITWQNGQPGGPCTSYSQLSADGGQQFGQPVKVADQFAVCGQAGKFVLQDQNFSVVLFNVLDQLSLAAWNGSRWSDLQPQGDLAAFTNSVTLDSVILSCQNVSFHSAMLYVVGCDKGNGGDIWFSSRSLGTLDDWFPPSSAWSAPVEVTSIDQKISAVSSVATGDDTIDTFWVQSPLSEGDNGSATVQYARWNGTNWSSPVSIIPQLSGSPIQLSVKADSQGRLLLAWVDSKTGEIFLTWANAARANNPGEWQNPQYIPSASKANSSPDILADASGRILVVFAVPINEQRGIYLVDSEDGGRTWTQPSRVFDAASAGWDIVDQPSVSLTGDGRLHVLFRRYSLLAEQRQSSGLYYSQSADGGVTWSAPEAVSEAPVLWSEIIGYGRSVVHRLWQQDKQSALITFHQVSRDGGQTWSGATPASSIEAASTLNSLSIDRAGNLDLLQVNSTDNFILLEQRWDGSGWISQTPQEMYVKDRGVPSSITASTTSKGNLLVSISVDYPSLTVKLKNDILSVGKSLGSPKVIPTPYPAIIPAAKQPQVLAVGTPDVLLPSTKAAPPQGLNDSPSSFSRAKNLVGILLLGGILFLLFLIFRPAPRKPEIQHKTSR